MSYEFTNDWFERTAKNVWDQLIPQINPTKILEIGSYEGASTCYLIEKIGSLKNIEVHCIDTWEGGIDNKAAGANMFAVEQRFHKNTDYAVGKVSNHVEIIIHKNNSDLALSRLVANGQSGYFDFVYVDGSHQAPDVLCDAVLGFRLLRKNGIIVFDDYLWQESLPYGVDPVRSPKISIDAFTNAYCRKLKILSAPLYQLYIQKISD